jgi:phage shock protein PspC (stress-responsive transcriptional regulator)
MNTTKNISLGGYAFIIEENAYESLKKYLTAVESRLGSEAETKEIMSDVESRIAEIFREGLNTREVVCQTDVEIMISRMGDPEVFGPSSTKSEEMEAERDSTERKLFRDTENKIMGGVCGGLGAFAGVDPIWFRLGFAIAFFSFGTGILLYLILWILMPAAKTRAQKLQMRGKRPDLKNLEKSILSELEHIGSGISGAETERKIKEGADSVTRTVSSLFSRLFQSLGKIFQFLLKGLALLLALGCLVFLVALATMLVTGNSGLVIENNRLSTDDSLSFLFSNPWSLRFFLLFCFLFLAIPTVAVLAHAIRFLANLKTTTPKWITFFGVLFWVIALAGLMYLGIDLGLDFGKQAAGKSDMILNVPGTSTLHLQIADEENTQPGFQVTDVSLDIRESADTLYHLKIIKEASGRSKWDADARQKNIHYIPVMKDSVLRLPASFFLAEYEVYRNQTVMLELQIPRGRSVYPAPGMQQLLHGVDNVQNRDDSDMVGLVWDMTPAGLSCRGCAASPKDTVN